MGMAVEKRDRVEFFGRMFFLTLVLTAFAGFTAQHVTCPFFQRTLHCQQLPKALTMRDSQRGKNQLPSNSLKQIKFHHWEDEWETSDNLGENKSSEGTAA